MNAEERSKNNLEGLAKFKRIMSAFKLAGYSDAKVSRSIGSRVDGGTPILPATTICRMKKGDLFPTAEQLAGLIGLASREGIEWERQAPRA